MINFILCIFDLGQNSTLICGAGSQICLRQAEGKVATVVNFCFNLLFFIEEARTMNILEEFLKLINSSCNCKPSCSELKFNAETSHSDFYFNEYFKENSFLLEKELGPE